MGLIHRRYLLTTQGQAVESALADFLGFGFLTYGNERGHHEGPRTLATPHHR